MKLSLRFAPQRKSHPSSYKFTLDDTLIVFGLGVNENFSCGKQINYPAAVAKKMRRNELRRENMPLQKAGCFIL